MNERIRLLAEQAGYKPLPGFDFANSLEEVFIKKFAELIVKECGKIVTIWSDEKPCSEGYDITPVAKMKEHFGVEE